MTGAAGESARSLGPGHTRARPVSALAVTAVICTRDRPKSLLRCVGSIAAQTLPPADLIVVDDGHLAPEHRESLASLCAGAGIRLAILQKSVPGLPSSRNLAVRHATGDIVQFLDDDVELDPEFCRQILRLYEWDPDGCVAGIDGVLVDPQPSTVARVFEIVYRLAGWWALPPKNVRRPPLPPDLRDRRWAVPTWVLSGACMSFRRSALQTVAFDEGLAGYALGEDRDASLQISRQGWLLHARGARAVHRHDPAGRPDPFQFGRMTVLNYARIMRRIGRTSFGDRLVITYTLTLIAANLAFFALLKPRRYAPELKGLLTGALELARSWLGKERPDTQE